MTEVEQQPQEIEVPEGAEDVEALVNSRGEVSHSPLNVGAARKRFQTPPDEEVTPQRDSSKPAGAPKPLKDGKYFYEDLKMPSRLTKDHIDVSARETYLSSEEFEQVFEMSLKEFQGLPQWKKDQKKKAVGLF